MTFKWVVALAMMAANPCFADARDTQTEIQNKYWAYRLRLLKNFVRIGEGQARSIAPEEKYGPNYFRYADNTSYHAWYLLSLAFEHSVLKRSGQSTRLTDIELYYGLKAFERLDRMAEPYYRKDLANQKPSDLNGFFIRDDADLASVKKLFPNTTQVKSDYVDGMNPGKPEDYGVINEESQDQAIDLQIAFRAIDVLLDEDVTVFGQSLRKISREHMERMIHWIAKGSDKPWVIENPITLNGVGRGPDARGFAKGFKRTLDFISPNYSRQNGIHSSALSEVLFAWARTGGIPVFYNQAMVQQLMTTSSPYGFKQTQGVLNWYKVIFKKGIYPALHKIFNGDRFTSRQTKRYSKEFQKLLEEAPLTGPTASGPAGWNSSNRWLYSEKGLKTTKPPEPNEEQYTGFDFMALAGVFFTIQNTPMRRPIELDVEVLKHLTY